MSPDQKPIDTILSIIFGGGVALGSKFAFQVFADYKKKGREVLEPDHRFRTERLELMNAISRSELEQSRRENDILRGENSRLNRRVEELTDMLMGRNPDE